MKRQFCDACGSESPEEGVLNICDKRPMSNERWELCAECTEKVRDFLRGMKTNP